MKNELMNQLKKIQLKTAILSNLLFAKKIALREINVDGTKVLKSQIREVEEHRSSLWFAERKLVEKLCVIEAVEQPNEHGDEAELKELHQLIVVDGVQTYNLTKDQFELFTDYVNMHAMKFR